MILKLESLSSDLFNTGNELSTLEKEKNKLKKLHNELKSADNLKSEDIDNLKDHLQSLIDQLQAKNSENDHLKALIDEKTRQAQQIQADGINLENEIGILQKELKNEKKKNLKSQNQNGKINELKNM